MFRPPLLPLVLLASLLLGACKVVLVETDCLRVVAAEVSQDGGRVHARTVYFQSPAHCQPIARAHYVAYRDRNGRPGYQADGEPPDVLVNQVQGDTAGQPTHEMSISNLSNAGSTGGFADSWQVAVTTADGSTSTYSGNF